MKTIINKILILILLFFTSIPITKAYNFSQTNNDGAIIYYNITSTTHNTVEVTHHFIPNAITGFRSDYNNAINIPANVTYNGINYTVTSIGDSTFFFCEGVTSINLPNTIQSIGNYACAYCSRLSSINTPQAITYIGIAAFLGCQITTLYLGKNVNYIGNYFVDFCSLLTNIDVDNNNPTYSCFDGVLYNKTQDTLIRCPEGKTGNISFANNVKVIGFASFYLSKLQSISLPNTITKISHYAFCSASNLQSINLSNNLRYIGMAAFAKARKLTTITLPSTLDSIGLGAFSLTCGAYPIANNLSSIVSKSILPPLCSRVSTFGNLHTIYDTTFCGVDKTIPVYVPCGSKHLYEVADMWEDFTNIIELPYKSIDTITDSFCNNSSYNFNGRILTSAGIYNDTLQTADSCDSILVLNLRMNPTYNDTTNKVACGTSYDFNGRILTQAGTYTDTLQTVFGCDSIMTINLSFSSTSYDTVYATICHGTAYTNYGFNETESGTYTNTIQTASGCDSIITLHLNVLPTFTDTINADIYRGDTFTFYGFNASESGTFTQVYQDTNGCDSTYVLNLNVIQLMFPTVITANSDGINDIFEIHDLLNQTFFNENELTIYSRYGKKVYHKNNIKKKEDFWNPNSTNSPTGTYFYRFKAKGNKKIIDFTGSVEILR